MNAGYILFPEQCKRDCIPTPGQSCHSTQMVEDHRKKQVYAVCDSKTAILQDCQRPMVENNTFSTLPTAKETIAATTGVSVSQQLVRVVPKPLGYNHKKESSFTHGHPPLKLQALHS